MTTDELRRWLPLRRPAADARMRLLCFPFAGGPAQAFADWQRALGPAVDVCAVQLPGRWGRIGEPPLESIDAMVAATRRALSQLLTGTFVLFGYSMGSLIAFDLARQLRRGGCAEPAHLIVASRRAPQLSPGQDPLPDQLDDHDFARWVAERYGGMPEEILAEPSLLEAIVPCMRSDLRAHFDYRYREERPLSIPISAFSGIADPNVSETQLLGWREHTSASFAVQRFPGGHFFMQDRAADLFLQIQAIATDLLGS